MKHPTMELDWYLQRHLRLCSQCRCSTWNCCIRTTLPFILDYCPFIQIVAKAYWNMFGNSIRWFSSQPTKD